MSFRRTNSRRSRRSNTDEEVENPNAYGFFGRYEDAPEVVQVMDHDHDQAGNLGHAHEHRLYGYDDHHPGWQTVEVHQNPTHTHHFHRRFQHTQQQQHDHGPLAGSQADRPVQAQQGHAQMAGSMYEHPAASTSGMFMGTAHDISNQYMITSTNEAETPLVSHGAPQGTGSASHSQDVSRQNSKKGSGFSAFDMVHGASSGHIAEHGEQIPVRIGHLFKRPLIRQWVLQDKVYREVDDREPSQFELFFDLVMVGIIHKLADAAAEAATGLNVAKFILCFYPAWSIWTDVRSYINVSGTDDVWQRIYVLLIMILLSGYAANATGIIIEKAHDGEQEGSAVPESEAEFVESAGTHARRALFAVAGTVGTAIVKRSEGGATGRPPPVLVREIGHTGYWFASGWHAAIASAIGFYLVAKFCRLALFFIYGLLLPKFRKALWANGVALLIISATYLPIIFIDAPGIIVILICAGVILELTMRYLVAAVLQVMHGRAKHKGHKTYLPAYSLPHMMERTTLFTILVIGEMIMNATYVAYSGEYGPQSMFWRAALSIVIAFLLMWIYFDVDSSRTFVHGLKRHWFTSISYTHLHFPLCAALILMSSSLAMLITREAVEQESLWFFSGSLALVMFIMGVLGVLHKSLDRWGSSLIPKSARIGVRFVLAAIFAVMPKLHHWQSVEFLGAHAAMLALAVAFETFGKLGAVGRVYDPVRSEALRQQRLGGGGDEPVGQSATGGTGEIPMANMLHPQMFGGQAAGGNASSTEKLRRQESRFSMGAVFDNGMRKINKDGMVKSPGRRASWHEYDDLTGAERGEEDVGIESELGRIEAKQVSSGERWAYVAT